ncbi:6715_t:CDS:2, partial [Paraglomus brasilianum]
MDKVENYSSKAEEILHPLKPYVSAIARFLIVVTFLEDSFRIVFQWEDQIWYLSKYRGMPWEITHLFLALNVIIMVAQSIRYGLIFDLNFFLRNLSVIGGLFMVLSEAFAKKKSPFPGLPQLSENDRKKYLQLA